MIDDTAAYLAKHPDHKHVKVPWGDAETERLVRVWRTLLESQNGEGVDGCGDAPADGGAIGNVLRAHVPPGSRVLILGAGRGQEVDFAQRSGYAAIGSTLGAMNVAIARETFGLDLRFEDSHISDMPASTLDVVIGLQVIEHSFSPLILAIECGRLLRSGGLVVFETPSPKYHHGGRFIHHVLCPTPRQMVGLLEKAGFEDVRQWIGDTPVSDDQLDRGDFAADMSLRTIGRRVDLTTAIVDPIVRLLLESP